MSEILHTAILGAGAVVPEFLTAIHSIPEFQVTTIFGREKSREKVTRFAEEHSIPKVCFQYEEILSDPEIDVLYIALPNHLHYEYAKEALENGKHVIVEKPFTGTYKEAKDLVDTARKKHVFVFEAVSSLYLPNYLETKKLLPTLGDIKIVEMNFSQYSHRYDDFKAGRVHPVFDPEKYGGALMDINVYNIHLAAGLFGRPKAIHYYANLECGIDTSGILLLEYSAFICTCIGAKDCSGPCQVSIQGNQGEIVSHDPANTYTSFTYQLYGKAPQEVALNRGFHRMYSEMNTFAKQIKSGDENAVYEENEESLLVMEILDEARTQVGMLKNRNR